MIARVVRNHSPGAFRLFLYGSTGVAGEIGVDGWADDGEGRARVYVVHETAPGAIEADPCWDSAFVAGGTCRAVRLQDGSTSFVRGEAGTTYKTVMAVLRHPDGSGVSAESDNGWFDATKNPDTRRRRVDVSISKMTSGKRRPCCFNLSACTDPDVSKNGRLLEPGHGLP